MIQSDTHTLNRLIFHYFYHEKFIIKLFFVNVKNNKYNVIGFEYETKQEGLSPFFSSPQIDKHIPFIKMKKSEKM